MPRFSASGELEEIDETALLVRENLGEEARSEVASILVKSVQSFS
jgi:transcriptional regulator GlxA family with amidase domain